jgi:hypothetical protein
MGPEQIPGLIVMSIQDDAANRVDPNYDLVVVLWNADPQEVIFTLEDLEAGNLELHPLLVDAHNSQAFHDAGTKTFTIPGRSTAVFVRQNPVEQLEAEETVAPSETPEFLELTEFPTHQVDSEEGSRSSSVLLLIGGSIAVIAIGIVVWLFSRRRK